jgi:hypothetical protein
VADPIEPTTAPLADEGRPGLGDPISIAEDRRQSGDLPDQPDGNPVRNDAPYRNLRQR